MASYMLVRHKVKQFSDWKSGYDDDLDNRNKAGLSEKYLLHNAQDPNEVVVMFETADIDKAKAFADSSELRETMQKLGVVDKPDIYFLQQ